jgi:S-DNA-T family DNA segregation ATPase FtsK/SpoIIIE
MAKEPKDSHLREIWAVVLVGMALLLLLSLVSYHPDDYGTVASSGSRVIHNFIGPAGAWIAYATFQSFGLAAYFLMAVLGVLGVVLLMGRQIPWRSKVGAGVLLLVSAACLFHVAGLETLRHKFNIPSSGGFVGMFMGGMFQSLLGSIGTSIVFFAAYLISLIILINLRPSYWVTMAAGWAQDFWAEIQAGKNKGSVLDELSEKEKEMRQREIQLKRELAKSERAAKKLAGAKAKSNGATEVEEEQSEPSEPEIEVPEPKFEDRSTRHLQKPEASDDDHKNDEKKPGLVEKFIKPKLKDEGKPAPKPAVPPTADVLASGGAAEGEQYVLPSIDMLDLPPAMAQRSIVEDLKASAVILKDTLADFGIEVKSGDVTKGPTITLFELYPAPGVKVERIQSLSQNIALAMKAEKVRIISPVPGKGTVGVEVPNSTTTTVYLRDILESDEWRKAMTKAKIPIALGRDVKGNAIIADLADMPHLLIAGATGSGKTVCVNAILAALMYRFTAEDLRLVLVDPKMVEMQHLNALPHLVIPVVTEPKKVPLALGWVIREMEKRYQIFAKVGVRNINAFNNRKKKESAPPPAPVEFKPAGEGATAEPAKSDQPVQEELKIEVPRDGDLIIPERLPFIVVVVDELADLMHTVPVDVESAIARLTALARAAGIHLIIATQRPSVDVVTGVIKSNIPARIAFQVASKQDSRVILDTNGADKLLGKGDMLYQPAGAPKPIRAQGVFVTDDEIKRIVDFIGNHAKPRFEPEIHKKLQKPVASAEIDEPNTEDEELVEQCVEVIRQTNRASVSILQRRLRIGYTRAARIMDLLEERGIVGPPKGSDPREILVDLGGSDSREEEPQ